MQSQDRNPKILDRIRNVMRLLHYSFHTERMYIYRIKRYIGFHPAVPRTYGANCKIWVYLVLICFTVSQTAVSQIGAWIPDNRLPLVSAQPRQTVWQEAGCLLRLTKNKIRVTRTIDIVTDYGAKGDNAFDNADSIRKALDHVDPDGFTILYFPAGIYRTSRNIELPSNVVLKGAGSEKSVLCFYINTHCITVKGCERTGIEDLKLIRDDDETKGRYFIRFRKSSDCWVRGVETSNAHSNHISIGGGSRNIEISQCYIHDATNHGGGGNGYGVTLEADIEKCLIENNVFQRLRHAIVTGGKCHWNVCGYNAMFDNHTDTFGHGVVFVSYTGDIEIHGNCSAPASGAGAYENLFEGNYANLIWIDAYWGDNGSNNTFFRNTARKGGMLIQDRSNTSHGGRWENCNNNQNILNNVLICQDWCMRQRFGAPWGDGTAFSTRVGGKDHWIHNNEIRYVNFFMSGATSIWVAGKETEYLSDFSYYHPSKPDFMTEWPYDPCNLEKANPAGKRYLDGGQVTKDAGFSDYQGCSIWCSVR